jgi:hypothetical protein
VDPDRFGIAPGPQLPVRVPEVADQLLLLGVDRDGFLVSTEMAGSPAVIAALTVTLMYSNWALRSG